ncbi:hypothetical protein SAMN04488103_12022, partial [Gemmobacter aquatilis]
MHISQSSPPSSAFRTVLHIGAGRGARLEEFRAAGATRIILIEPNESLAATLVRNCHGLEDVEILTAGFTGETGKAELQVMNLPSLSSLHSPAPALKELFPGLQLLERQEISLLSPSELMQKIALAEHPVQLVFDAPGSEFSALKALEAEGGLAVVDLLELRCGEDVCYEEAVNRAHLENWLVDRGFQVETRDLSDPDWPVLHLRADPARRELVRLARALGWEAASGTAEDIADFIQNTALQARAAALAEAEAARDHALEHAARLEQDLADSRET